MSKSAWETSFADVRAAFGLRGFARIAPALAWHTHYYAPLALPKKEEPTVSKFTTIVAEVPAYDRAAFKASLVYRSVVAPSRFAATHLAAGSLQRIARLKLPKLFTRQSKKPADLQTQVVFVNDDLFAQIWPSLMPKPVVAAPVETAPVIVPQLVVMPDISIVPAAEVAAPPEVAEKTAPAAVESVSVVPVAEPAIAPELPELKVRKVLKLKKPVIAPKEPVVTPAVQVIEAKTSAEVPAQKRGTLRLKTAIEVPTTAELSRKSSSDDLAALFRAEMQSMTKVSTADVVVRKKVPVAQRSLKELAAEASVDVQKPAPRGGFDLARLFKAELEALTQNPEALGLVPPVANSQPARRPVTTVLSRTMDDFDRFEPVQVAPQPAVKRTVVRRVVKIGKAVPRNAVPAQGEVKLTSYSRPLGAPVPRKKLQSA